MKKKLANPATRLLTHGWTRRVRALAAFTFLALLFVWSVNHSTITIFMDVWRYPMDPFSQIVDHPSNFSFSSPHNSTKSIHNVKSVNDKINVMPRNKTKTPDKISVNQLHNVPGSQRMARDQPVLNWVEVEVEQNYTSEFLSRYVAPKGDPNDQASKTVDIKFLNFDGDSKPIVMSTGYAHEVFFQALDESRNSQIHGGDYFEIDLAGEWWRSRPLTRDLGNGTYSFTLQVHPNFSGAYNLTIILLYRNFEGLHPLAVRLIHDKQLRNIPITFSKSDAKLSELHLCKKSDFNRDVWAGRWTRLAKNDECEIRDNGRYMCLGYDHPCRYPWCTGSLGLLESNGWVYSAHCSFRLFSSKDAWNCLNNRWIFFWGDSNHVDTIRNVLFFILGVPLQELKVVSRRFDKNFANPKDKSQSVRITNIFNGHWNVTQNYLGLKSLSHKGYSDLIKAFFNGPTVPDTIIFNSGLHDAFHWRQIEQFVAAVETAASFWRKIIDGAKHRGLNVSDFIFRSSIAAAGNYRILPSNPSKAELFNRIIAEKLREAGLVTAIIDDFDMTWTWHFDLRCTDGTHYGRFPSKSKWMDGQIGHQYFVDLMLGHVILNAICPV